MYMFLVLFRCIPYDGNAFNAYVHILFIYYLFTHLHMTMRVAIELNGHKQNNVAVVNALQSSIKYYKIISMSAALVDNNAVLPFWLECRNNHNNNKRTTQVDDGVVRGHRMLR